MPSSKLKEIVNLYKDDEDGDGELDPEEFEKAFRNTLGIHFTGLQIEHYFNSVDTDGSGKVSWEELSKALRNNNRDIGEHELILDLASLHKMPLASDSSLLDKFDCPDHEEAHNDDQE